MNPHRNVSLRYVLPGIQVLLATFFLATPLPAQNTLMYSRQTGALQIAAPQHQSGQTSGEPTQVLVYQPPPTSFAPFCEGGGSGPAGASEARSDLLDKKGPQLPGVFNMSNFYIMGFAKGSWPVVVDYFLEQDSLLIVVVAPEGMVPAIYHLDGKKGHWQSRISLPVSIGPKPVVAHYAIRALDDNIGQVSTSHLHIHGIAAGEKAVGSIGIDQVSFSPAAIHVAMGEQARYMFHSKMDFKNVDVDFVRLAVYQGQIIAARVGGKSMGSVNKNDQKTGNWDGKSDGGGKYAQSYPPELRNWLKAPQGQHLVQVRAWWGAKDGDWATALSDDFVTVE